MVINIKEKFIYENRDEETNYRSDRDEELNREIATNGVESLVEIKKNDIRLYKDLILRVDSFIACLGPPGGGKSSFCSSYYKYKYNVKENFFKISDNAFSFTKGLWILKEEQRRKIKEPIKRDVIDVEGFEIDSAKSWKYVMATAFLATDIILINRNTRADDLKKVLAIIGSALDKMKKANIPRILKTICFDVPNKKFLSPEGFETIKKELKENLLEQLDGIELKPFYIPYITEDEFEDYNGDITQIPKYRKSIEDLLSKLTPEHLVNSVSSLNSYIDDFNSAINGEHGFNTQAIFEDLRTDFEGVYNRYYNKHRNFLLSKKDEFKKLEDLNETFDEYVDKQNLDFTFKVNRNEYTFYGSSKVFNEKYEEFEREKDFKINPEEILLDLYESQKKEIKYKNEAGKTKILEEVNLKKAEINNYFSQIPFYGNIDSNYDCSLKIDTVSEEDKKFKVEQENELKQYYKKAEEQKRQSWKDQIERAKWKCIVQAYGDLTCKNGCNLTDQVHCRDCKQVLYWVDGDERYVICKSCGDKSVRKISNSLICLGCGAACNAKVKFVTGYKP